MITVKILDDKPLEVKILGELTNMGAADVEHYTGAYEVTPQRTEQVLPTAEKIMNNDVTVKATPYHEVENTQGGMTAIIGG